MPGGDRYFFFFLLDKMEPGGGLAGLSIFIFFFPLLQPFSLFLSLYQQKKKKKNLKKFYMIIMIYIGFLLPDIYN